MNIKYLNIDQSYKKESKKRLLCQHLSHILPFAYKNVLQFDLKKRSMKEFLNIFVNSTRLLTIVFSILSIFFSSQLFGSREEIKQMNFAKFAYVLFLQMLNLQICICEANNDIIELASISVYVSV